MQRNWLHRAQLARLDRTGTFVLSLLTLSYCSHGPAESYAISACPGCPVDLVAVLQHERLDLVPCLLWLAQNLKLFGRVCFHRRETSGGRPWFLCPRGLRLSAMEECTRTISCPLKGKRRHVRTSHLENADSAMNTTHRGVSQKVPQLSKEILWNFEKLLQLMVCKICDTIQAIWWAWNKFLKKQSRIWWNIKSI